MSCSCLRWAAFVFALAACGGGAAAASDAGGGVDGGGQHKATATDAGGRGDGSMDGQLVAASDDANNDAATPDGATCNDAASFPVGPDASCHSTFVVYPACARTCFVTAADVVCNATADCTTVVQPPSCVGGGQVYGVSKTSNAGCPGLPCVPPKTTPPPPEWETEDCQIVSSHADIGVKCVDHQCVTFAVAAP